MRLPVDPPDLDVVGFGDALRRALLATLAHPAPTLSASVRLAGDLARAPVVAATRWLGGDVEPPVAPDRRFADPAWTSNPLFHATRLGYAAASRFARDVVGAAALEPDVARKAALATDLLLDAAAPTNLLPLNPAALRLAFDTGGASLVRGARNFVDDLVNNRGRPRQVDTSGFELGRDLAATPAKVVFRNELMELLQYEPQTERVHAVPLLCSPPWINKYYVMDLAPGRSFVEWAVRHGRTVFAISYRNPSPGMAATTMDDYLVHGPRTAVDVITAITGADTVDIVGLCLGGALTAITAAHLAGAGDRRVGSLTLLNTMLDYTEPGPLATFTDARTVAKLERRMAERGTLPASSMAATFDLLRANDLIFGYLVSGWLMGQDPPAFDILAWNADSTRMPAAMHAFYLREFYVGNALAAGTLRLAGAPVDLGAITSPVYVVSAVNDHIVPWESAYRSVGLVAGPARFVLVSGGHIAGIVSPPGPKAWHMVGDGGATSAQDWREGAQRRPGTWWEDWVEWARAGAGPLREPPPTGSRRYPVLGEGPGRYVRG
ncbi:PHA/PHB synthase family protein [Pseudonocardia lacus]|uniref:PHA/PHB synthase family protein n=1 Tax=Pseudonocardia lacus TaxID=2835865 RepID=UPI001BDD4B84|nr:alpha/beta fold hydrolase [Pseudonocardia lacus]